MPSSEAAFRCVQREQGSETPNFFPGWRSQRESQTMLPCAAAFCCVQPEQGS